MSITDAKSTYATGSVVAAPESSSVNLYAAPGSSQVLDRVASTTRFGSPTRLAVIGREAGWLVVVSDALANDERGYVRRDDVQLTRVRYSVEVDVSRRLLKVWQMGVVVRSFAVAVGGSSSPTPSGRFSITDKLADFNPAAYGCCVLALSGHQTQLAPGWTGGDRLAIHGGGGIGGATSSGCLHARTSDLEYLMARLPLGTQVVIHP
ncbi:MAG TPA: L,D-transpeptidase [Gaiellaceae bacterium]